MSEAVTIGNCTLYLGDCRDILPTLEQSAAIITDPPWDAAKGIPGSDNPPQLFADIAPIMALHNRVVTQLGCDSDPVFLEPLGRLMPFLRTCWLRYACPSYKGRLLHTGDVAYAYGHWPKSKKGAQVIPGECTSTTSDKEFIRGPRKPGKEKGGWEALSHPMPRRLQHVQWLVNWFSQDDEYVIDPFMGSGTTGVAAMRLQRKFIGIEIHEPFFDLACQRLEKAHAEPTLFTPAIIPTEQMELNQ